jgi:hypothetical protein
VAWDRCNLGRRSTRLPLIVLLYERFYAGLDIPPSLKGGDSYEGR